MMLFQFLILGFNNTEYDQVDIKTTTIASNNGNQTKTIIEYKGLWNEIKCTIWIWICALLCTLYIVVGIPLLKYLNRSDDETEEVTKEVIKEVTKDTPKKVHDVTAHHTMYIRNLIAKSLAISNSAFNSSKLM